MTLDTTPWPGSIAGIAYGGDYTPEQWPESVWVEDVRLMREAHVSLVTVGVFAWARSQPHPDTWDLGWLDRAMDLLADNGIAVDLATGTASPPPWFSRRHPDSLPVDARGTRLGIGSRQHICPSSPAFAEAATARVERLAAHVAGHPALVMWHIGNEYGDHVTACYCDVSAAHFRSWLRARYGTLDALNEAWCASVWSGLYGDWEELMPPRAAPGPILPALQLDYRRFSSDALLACFERERTILARITPDIPATTNFMRPNPGIDHWRWALREDIVSCDLYPDPLDPDAEVEMAFAHDLMRSLGRGRPWLVMEQAMAAVDWRPVNIPQEAAVVRRRNLAAVGRGADGLLFFQWRGSPGGPEMLHSAMLPPGGTTTRGWTSAVALGADLRRLAEVAGSRCPPAQVCLLVDWESWWALEQEGHPSDALRYRDLALRTYRPLRDRGFAVDMRHPEDDLSGYRLVVVPNLFLVSVRTAERLTAFARDGGIVVIGPFSGVVDAQLRLPGGHHPGQLRDLLGIAIEEWWPIPNGRVSIATSSGDAAQGAIWRDLIDLVSAEAVAWYTDGDLEGMPAITRARVGDGQAWYAGTLLDDAGMAWLIREATEAAGVAALVTVPPGVDVLVRQGPDARYVFLIERTGAETHVPLHDIRGTDLLTGVSVGGEVRLGPNGVMVIREVGRRGSAHP